MRIDPVFQKTYPKLSSWIQANLPKVKVKPKVWNAFKKYSELKEPSATWAITNGYNPDITYAVMPGSNGRFNGGKFPNRVYLAKSICDRFESVDFSNPLMHLLLESTILHEMVHWGDHKDGKDQAGEEGKAFEVAAYGKNINRYWR
ncbi:hypothetical protein [Teredinibacter waterburyi]|uniref:hypothetical protein n=1 Tax=Teredinibacter waterburyi TaxID=1500538 RepID=UPI00165FF098|nr:hypothetical protein [Teredinibacter waterburyi]